MRIFAKNVKYLCNRVHNRLCKIFSLKGLFSIGRKTHTRTLVKCVLKHYLNTNYLSCTIWSYLQHVHCIRTRKVFRKLNARTSFVLVVKLRTKNKEKSGFASERTGRFLDAQRSDWVFGKLTNGLFSNQGNGIVIEPTGLPSRGYPRFTARGI